MTANRIVRRVAHLGAPCLLAAAATAQTTLLTVDGPPQSRLGTAVADAGDVDADGVPDLVIGVPASDVTGHDAGAVWIVSGATGATLRVVHGAAAGDYFGFAVAAAGDVDEDGYADFLVGAPYNDNNGQDSGTALVISGATGATLRTFNGPANHARFGWAVALAGDVDGDGRADFAIGAPFVGGGQVWIHSGRTPLVLRVLEGTALGDRFGSSVAAGADVDGRPELLVGAPLADVNGSSSGSVSLFDGAAGVLRLVVSGAAADDLLGSAVAFLDDADGDLVPDFAVGAPGVDGSWNNAGEVRVCSGLDGTVLWTGRGTQPSAALGTAVAFLGDATGDGSGELAVGSPSSGAGGAGTGRVTVFEGGTGARLAVVDGEASELRFGAAVAGAGDFDGDGRTDLVAGAPDSSSAGTLAGRVRVVSLWVDCNGNAVHDGVDLLLGTSTDCDQDLVPDECQADCDADGVPDSCAVASGAVSDCDGDGVPDRCQLGAGTAADCDGNGVLDACDIAAGAPDQNGNGIPDACDVQPYCTSLPTSVSPGATIFLTGTTSVSANDLVLHAWVVPYHQNGLFLYSPDQANLPLGNGILCLGNTTQGFVNRLPGETASFLGQLVHAVDLTSPPAPGSLILPGSTWNFQAWFRDPAAGGAGFNFSSAFALLFEP